MLEENFQDFEISELSGTAILPSYATAVVHGIDGDMPKLPKILSRKAYNTNPSELFKESKPHSTSKSASKHVMASKSQSRSVSRSNKGSQPAKTKDYFILNHKKIDLEQEIKPKKKQKWIQPPTSRKPTIQQLREHIYKKEFKQCTFQPKISQKKKVQSTTKQFVNPKKTKRQGVFDRLYQKAKETNLAQKSLPNVLEKAAKSTRRESPIEQYLYSDALRRRGRDTLLEKKQFKSTFNNSMRMEKMAGQRFVKEYSSALQSLDLNLRKTLSLVQIHKVLSALNFTHTKKIIEDHPQNTLIYELYEILGGNIENGVRIKNLLMFLLAVNGISNVEQVNVYDPIKVDIRGVEVESEFGLLISQQGVLLMNQELGKRIHNYFDVMYRNRLSRIKNQERKGKGKNGENKENENREYASRQKGGKSRESKKSSVVTSKRQSQAVITHNRKAFDNFKKVEEPLPSILNPTHQTHQSLFSEESELVELSRVFNIQSFPIGITLEIELKDGTVKDLIIGSADKLVEAVQEFCEVNSLDEESRDQVLQVAHQAFQCAEP